jgi:hypothetical protein
MSVHESPFDDNEDAWVDEIVSNVETLLQAQPVFMIQKKFRVVLVCRE